MSDWGNHNGSVRYLSSTSTTIEHKKKSKCIESSWMTVNSNWSLMDNSCFKWNVFNKGSWHLKIIRIWFIYQKVRFIKDVLLFTRNIYRRCKIYWTNTFSAKLQFKQYKLAPISHNQKREIYYSVDIFLALSVCFTSNINGFNNWCPRAFLFSILSFLLFFLVAFFEWLNNILWNMLNTFSFILILSLFFKKTQVCNYYWFLLLKEYWNTTVTTITR